MIQAGILSEEDKIELLNGEMIHMSPVGPRHSSIVNRLTAIFSRLMSQLGIVSVQNPITLAPNSEPEPDLTLAKLDEDYYEFRHPGSDDIYLVIEVADSTLQKDRTIKSAIYAAANISHYWIINLNDNQVEVYESPNDGKYTSIKIYQSGQVLNVPHFNETVSVDQLLGHS